MKSKPIRVLDILISLTILLLLSFLLVLISIIIYLFDGRPIFFKQIRIGYHGKKFKVYKFRTMRNKILKNENKRLTNIGKFLRRLSLDEIPQFINVLKGEMSVVGPRPLPEMIEKKIDKYLRTKRRNILPGITGMSQINYTGNIRKIEEKVKLDILYAENYSLYNYLKILTKTPYIIIVRFIKNKSTIIR